MAALCKGKGTTLFVENIFESRYRHVDELARMGADIRVEGRVARGVRRACAPRRGGRGRRSAGWGRAGCGRPGGRGTQRHYGTQASGPGLLAVSEEALRGLGAQITRGGGEEEEPAAPAGRLTARNGRSPGVDGCSRAYQGEEQRRTDTWRREENDGEGAEGDALASSTKCCPFFSSWPPSSRAVSSFSGSTRSWW